MVILTWILTYVRQIVTVIGGLFTLYVFKKNQDLKIENEILSNKVSSSKKVQNIQDQVIKVISENSSNKPVDISITIERMRSKKL